MEEKLREILDKYDEQIFRYEEQINKLESKIIFLDQHNFNEEKRIARIELDALSMVVFRFRNMYDEINDLLNAWIS